jgi:hypothetical protein
MWCMYTVEYYSTIMKNEIKLFTGKWMELEIAMLSEVSQDQKGKSCLIFQITWKQVLKEKCTHKYIYDLMYVYTYIYTHMPKYGCAYIDREKEREWEHACNSGFVWEH